MLLYSTVDKTQLSTHFIADDFGDRPLSYPSLT
jgi:hypothetical protein